MMLTKKFNNIKSVPFKRLLFVFIFIWGVPFAGSNILYYSALGFLSLVFLFKIPKRIYPKSLIKIFFPLLLFASITSFINSDQYSLIYFLRAFILTITSIAFAYIYFQKFRVDHKEFIKDNILLATFNSILMIAQIFLPAFRSFLIYMSDSKSDNYSSLLDVFRVSGLAYGGAGSIYGLFIALLLVISFMLKFNLNYLLMAFFSLVVSLLTGRLGLSIVFVVFFIYLIKIILQSFLRLKVKLNSLFFITSGLFFVFSTFFIVNFVNVEKFDKNLYTYTLARVQAEFSINDEVRKPAKEFINYMDSSSTFVKLKNGIKLIGIMPEKAFWIGSGKEFPDFEIPINIKSRSITRDSTYLKYIYSFGIVFSIIFSVTYFYFLWKGFSFLSLFDSYIIVLIMFFAMIKEDFYFVRYLYPVIIIVNILEYLQKKNNKKLI